MAGTTDQTPFKENTPLQGDLHERAPTMQGGMGLPIVGEGQAGGPESADIVWRDDVIQQGDAGQQQQQVQQQLQQQPGLVATTERGSGSGYTPDFDRGSGKTGIVTDGT